MIAALASRIFLPFLAGFLLVGYAVNASAAYSYSFTNGCKFNFADTVRGDTVLDVAERVAIKATASCADNVYWVKSWSEASGTASVGSSNRYSGVQADWNITVTGTPSSTGGGVTQAQLDALAARVTATESGLTSANSSISSQSTQLSQTTATVATLSADKIGSIGDAETVAAAFATLLAVAFGIRMIKRAGDFGEGGSLDEKH